MLSHFVIFRVS